MQAIQELILKVSGAEAILYEESVQKLWSDYGEIKRYHLAGGQYASLIVKHILLPQKDLYPKGWNTNISHQRKLQSYQVERYWYQQYTPKTNKLCRVPECYTSHETGNELLLVMEDLNTSGFPLRKTAQSVTIKQAKNCLSWLAHFHGQFMGQKPDGLWPVGTYWHLATRPDEWNQMSNLSLKKVAHQIDDHLQKAKYQTLVHGDAKLANFCFSSQDEVAAVDFQYVGKGCGMKDVAYFMSSCFDEAECVQLENELLQHYFNQLEVAVAGKLDAEELKSEWQALYPYAWADFYRFLDGWSPDHWKMHGYSKSITQKVIQELYLKNTR